MNLPGNVLFREIHKNSWLRKLPVGEKKTGAFSKRGERVWVVFCVHDDTDPWLEVYGEQKMAAAHKPDWCVSLAGTLHVSPTICPHEDEFEFVVTLPSDVVRLTAPCWEMMMEWVDSIGGKLRELHILSPKENVYSRNPEARLPLLPTRDPNSPLPLPPAGPSAPLPGTEPLQHPQPEGVGSGESTSQNGAAPVIEALTSHTASAVHPVSALVQPAATPVHPMPTPLPTPVHPVSTMIHSVPTSLAASASSPSPSLRLSNTVTTDQTIQPTLATTSSVYIGKTDSSVFLRTHPVVSCTASVPELASPASSQTMGDNNVTVIEVSAEQPASLPDVFNFIFLTDSLVRDDEEEEFFTPPVTPVLPRASFRQRFAVTNLARNNSTATDRCLNRSAAAPLQESTNHSQAVPSTSHPVGAAAVPNYDSLAVASSPGPEPAVTTVRLVGRAAPTDSTAASLLPAVPVDALMNGSPSLYEHVFLASEHSPRPQAGRVRNHRRSAEPGTSNASVPADRIRGGPSQRLQPPPHPFRQGVTTGGELARLTLREQQVLQLRREMLHPGGVRLQLRRKDCLNSIALVDVFGALWVAGWKQKEHPMLYNALHIGDQVLSIAGILVQSSVDTNKIIRSAPSLYVEFVVRRVPCGRVYVLRREVEGQSLGVIQEGNTAEIKDIVAGSVAASQGLCPRTPTVDGLSLTSWVITEINGRPLNLFFKDAEVRDRLNAVGLETSLLVQPCDLIRQIKKQLKAVRSYKEYIVQ